MALVVQKYGGSSLESAERIRRVAERIVATKKAGNDVVVVCSAMGDTTDELVDLATSVNPAPPEREMDMLLTAGERMSNALVAMAIASLGAEAVSMTGSQAGVITTAKHGNARIINVTPGRVEAALAEGKIVLVAGFQGVSQDTKDVTTLGRGGSDTTPSPLPSLLTQMSAKSIPTWTVSTLPTRASFLTPASWTRSPSKKCWRWPLLAPRS